MIGKPFAVVMVPLGILLVLEYLNFLTFNLGFDKVLIGAILIIVLQILNMIIAKFKNNHLGLIQIITGIGFIIPASLYLISYAIDSLPLIIGIVLIAEGLYALH